MIIEIQTKVISVFKHLAMGNKILLHTFIADDLSHALEIAGEYAASVRANEVSSDVIDYTLEVTNATTLDDLSVDEATDSDILRSLDTVYIVASNEVNTRNVKGVFDNHEVALQYSKNGGETPYIGSKVIEVKVQSSILQDMGGNM